MLEPLTKLRTHQVIAHENSLFEIVSSRRRGIETIRVSEDHDVRDGVRFRLCQIVLREFIEPDTANGDLVPGAILRSEVAGAFEVVVEADQDGFDQQVRMDGGKVELWPA